MPAAELVALKDYIEGLASEPDADPSERVADLRRVKDDLNTLQGMVDRYLGEQELRRESAAIGRQEERAVLRENADIRAELIKRGYATPEQMDDAGYLSHEELDAREADGTLEEAFRIDPAKLVAIAKRRHRNHGQFADEMHSAPQLKGRGGAAVVDPSGKPGTKKLKAIRRGRGTARPDMQRPAAPSSAGTPAAQQSPGTEGSPGTDQYEQLRRELDARAQAQAAAGVADRAVIPAHSPGTQVDTAPTPDPEAHRWSGKASQKELLAYVSEAKSQPATVDAFSRRDPKTGRRRYDKSRAAVHERIISKIMAGVPSQPAGQARVFFTGGGYASGKGGVVDNHADKPPDALVLDPDKIKAELPEFQQLLEHDPEANLLVYEEAWDISQEIQRRAIAGNMNVVVDGISDTSPEDMLNRVKLFTDAGYQRPKAVYVTIPTDEAIKRADNRAKNAKKPSDRRFIPEVIMRSVHRDVSATMPGVVKGAKDLGLDIEVWDNNQGKDADGNWNPPKQIFGYDAAGDHEAVLDDKLWDEFLAKGKERIPGVDDRAKVRAKETASKAETEAQVAAHRVGNPLVEEWDKMETRLGPAGMEWFQGLMEKLSMGVVAHLPAVGHHLVHNPEGMAHAVQHITSLVSGREQQEADLVEAGKDPADDQVGPEEPEQDEKFGEFSPNPLEGMYVDMPFESGSADPQPLEYEDLGLTYTEGGDFREAQQRVKPDEPETDAKEEPE